MALTQVVPRGEISRDPAVRVNNRVGADSVAHLRVVGNPFVHKGDESVAVRPQLHVIEGGAGATGIRPGYVAAERLGQPQLAMQFSRQEAVAAQVLTTLEFEAVFLRALGVLFAFALAFSVGVGLGSIVHAIGTNGADGAASVSNAVVMDVTKTISSSGRVL